MGSGKNKRVMSDLADDLGCMQSAYPESFGEDPSILEVFLENKRKKAEKEGFLPGDKKTQTQCLCGVDVDRSRGLRASKRG